MKIIIRDWLIILALLAFIFFLVHTKEKESLDTSGFEEAARGNIERQLRDWIVL